MFAPAEVSATDCTQVLRLHVGPERTVWYGYDGCLGEDSFYSSKDFLRKSILLGLDLNHVRNIRLLGTAANAELIIGLHQRRIRNPAIVKTQSVQLCSPGICSLETNRLDSMFVLQQLWQPSPTGLLPGGWHELSEKDYTTYALINALQENHGMVDDRVKRIVRYHPAWPALSFLPNHDVEAGCQLLAEIVDPRWFRHPFHPHRLTKLNSFLGLTPANITAYVGGGSPSINFRRLQLVLHAWWNRCPESGNKAPNAFLCRIVLHHGDHEKGLLRACQWFVRFVQEVWLHEIGHRRSEMTFVPSVFFRGEDESRAYDQHRATMKFV